MESQSREPLPLVVIVGPTASGKTSLAIDIAQQFGGEIICADSRTVYRGMDIGTAKPTKEERELVPHWGLDLIDPGDHFTVADFKVYAKKKMGEIRQRGNIPFLVGGSGLYVDSVLFDYQFGGRGDEKRRIELGAMSLEQLHEYCVEHNISLPENFKNKRYVIRAIENREHSTTRRSKPLSRSIIVGITTDKKLLRHRIQERANGMFNSNVVEEATSIAKRYGWHSEAMTGNIYPLIREHVEGELSLDQAKERFVVLDWRLAKRQMTWLKRNPFIKWLQLDEARAYLENMLAKK